MITRKKFDLLLTPFNQQHDKLLIDRLYEVKVYIDCNYSNMYTIVLDYILKNKLYNLPEYEIFNIYSKYKKYSTAIGFEKLEKSIDSSQIIIYFELIWNHYIDNK